MDTVRGEVGGGGGGGVGVGGPEGLELLLFV